MELVLFFFDEILHVLVTICQFLQVFKLILHFANLNRIFRDISQFPKAKSSCLHNQTD